MREVDGKLKPTESVNVVMQNKKGIPSTSTGASGSQHTLVSVSFVESFMSLGRNNVLHMPKGAEVWLGKQFCKKEPDKVSSKRNVNAVDESSEEDVYVLLKHH